MKLNPHFWTTTVGSFPHVEARELSARLVRELDIPGWPQLPARSFHENMYVQYSASLPGIKLNETECKIRFDTHQDLTPDLEMFYEHFLADDLDYFSLSQEYAAGFHAFEQAIIAGNHTTTSDASDPASWIKGQVTGPVSVGLTVTDQDRRAGLYDEMLADALVKNTAMHARWQARRLKKIRPNVIMAVDEPYMASFGSAYISLSRESVITMLDEVFEAIHSEGALAWVHCCANTDWSVLLSTRVDILNLDAYCYLENLALYPLELRGFLDRGGVIAWGIVPNTEEVYCEPPEELALWLRQGIEIICNKASARDVEINPEEFFHRSLLTTSCGLGSATVSIADYTLDVLVKVGEILRVETQKPD